MARPEASADAHFWGDLQRRMLLEWVWVTTALITLTIALSYFSAPVGLERLDHALYDKTLATASSGRANNDIVIIAIDDSSIDDLGYWPWRRALHARLLDKLGQARVVGLDLVFDEVNPSYPQDDEQLAQSIRQQGKVVLPVVLSNDNTTITPPLPLLATAAKHTGYINIYPDADGIIRSVNARQTLTTDQTVDHFILAMLNAAEDTKAAAQLTQSNNNALLIPYAGLPGHFEIYPYALVLNGQIPAERFDDKYVLVGSWGTGLGDSFPTPLSRKGETMSGIEILANGLQSALDNRWIQTPSAWSSTLLAALPVLLACLALRRLSPRRSLFVITGVFFSIFIGNWLLMHYAGLWIPPAASLIGVVLTYLVWSWRSQETALKHIDGELHALNRDHTVLDNSLLPAGRPTRDASLSARVTQLHGAIAQLRKAHSQREETLRFLSHDMRAPQNSILALTHLQEQADAAVPQAELLKRIDVYAHQTLELVDGFVQLARAEAMEISQQGVDIVDLIAQSGDDFWAQAKQRNISMVFTDHPDVAWVKGDPALLRRAWCNLIDNALKYSPDHTTITSRVVLDQNHWVFLIQDQGRGVPPDRLETLFTAFTRVGHAADGNPPGIGLGLAFVKTVVTRHGGSITVEDGEGVGSLFAIRLPRANFQ